MFPVWAVGNVPQPENDASTGTLSRCFTTLSQFPGGPVPVRACGNLGQGTGEHAQAIGSGAQLVSR